MMPGASAVTVTVTTPAADVAVTATLRRSVSASRIAVADASASPAGTADLATSAAVSRATTRASVFAWLHMAAWNAANARITNIGVSNATDNDVAAP